MPNRKSLSDIRATILRPAMTSQFYMQIDFPDAVQTYMTGRGLVDPQGGVLSGGLNLACSEASLPGSSLATLELTSAHTGVTERHVHRRMFDDRIDLTFYVDAQKYLPIRAFEYWKEYITGGSELSVNNPTDAPLASASHYYRMNYPDDYILQQGLKIIKFERDFDGSFKGNNGIVNGTQKGLTYNFVRAFPIAVASMPVSYDASSLLKCTVSMTYIRYYITNGIGDSDSSSNSSSQSEVTPSLKKQNISQEYYNNFGDNSQNATNFADFVNGTVKGIFGEAIG